MKRGPKKYISRSLFAKYFIACASIIISMFTVLGAAYIWFSLQYFKQDKHNLLISNTNQAVSITLSNLENYNYKYYDEWDLKVGYSILGKATNGVVFLTDTEGKMLVCSEYENCLHKSSNAPKYAVNKALNEGEYYEVGRFGGIYGEENYYTVGVPVKVEDKTVGIVFISASAKETTAFMYKIVSMYLLCSAGVLFIAFVVLYFLTNRMVEPFRNMVAVTKKLSVGDFSVRVPVEGGLEFEQLAESFNNMASSLAEMESINRSFIANVSHELKTPMTTISGFVDGILDGTIPKEKEKYYLETVSAETKRLSRVVKSMLNMARIESGAMKITLTSIDLHEIICETVFSFEKQIEEKNIEVVGLDSGKVIAKADEDLIHQVIYNLVENAVKFTNENGKIEFKFSQDRKMVYVAIRNSGAGIPENELQRLFERFYKSDKSRSLDKNGVGLGLYIVKMLMHMHNGDIKAKSEEGKYTEFEFSLPIDP
ncbi:MAG: HAMP domain-containing histidine kinase [Oscillospiraceae bacterium]|nr:HAMP domain-containing histidine kinase [Oscillospiraceae bacterium]